MSAVTEPRFRSSRKRQLPPESPFSPEKVIVRSCGSQARSLTPPSNPESLNAGDQWTLSSAELRQLTDGVRAGSRR
jgi:hypothetical protein